KKTMATGGLYEQGSPGPASSTNSQLQTITQNIPTKGRIPCRINKTASDANKSRNSRGRVSLQGICEQQNLCHNSFQYIYGTTQR
uniref:Uncharacterized protein n=1 Tax=Aegilops tauschii subsp. strangulata TaxID=200361 RepID=A0A453HAF8_AEGTS